MFNSIFSSKLRLRGTAIVDAITDVHFSGNSGEDICFDDALLDSDSVGKTEQIGFPDNSNVRLLILGSSV